MKILLATKATSKTGIGHLVRSLLISSLLTENDIENTVYIEQDGSLDIKYLLKEQIIINGDLEKLNNITKNKIYIVFCMWSIRMSCYLNFIPSR